MVQDRALSAAEARRRARAARRSRGARRRTQERPAHHHHPRRASRAAMRRACSATTPCASATGCWAWWRAAWSASPKPTARSAAADAAEASLREAEADLRELQEGTRAEQLAQARQAADSARANLARPRDHLVAPRSARADRRHHRRAALPRRRKARARRDGRRAARHRRAVRAHPRARTHSRARQGRHAGHAFASMASTRTFKGQVRFIASEAEFTPYYSLTAADRSRLSVPRRSGDRRCRRRAAALRRAASKSRWSSPPRRERQRAISARGLTRQFGAKIAVDHIDLDIPAGPHLRFPRAQWLRQVHHAAHALRHAAAERRPRRGVRPLAWSRTPRPSAAGSATCRRNSRCGKTSPSTRTCSSSADLYGLEGDVEARIARAARHLQSRAICASSAPAP